jgi:hypothetical protein
MQGSAEGTIVSRRAALLEARVDDEIVGLQVDSGRCYGFNGTATRIWGLIEQPRRLSELRDALVADYEVDQATCEAELRELLAELERDGLVALDAAPSA